ncbi:MAG: rhomboid family intramembrane serine protease [Planctomycetota bacterium]
MDQPSSDGEVLRGNRRECAEAQLVLNSVGISSSRRREGGVWILRVDPLVVTDAKEQLRLYHDENAEQRLVGIALLPARHGIIVGVVVYAFLLIGVAAVSQPWGMGEDLATVGAMHARSVMEGQWYRNFTALMLHADIGHLLSNLLFGILFGVLASRRLGGGVAWLTIVVAGACGNLINALTRPPDHSSIGASTAVFAALGLLVADALHPMHHANSSRWKRHSPLIAGVVLLSLLGVGGPKTDVNAHVTGFLSGLVIGWLSCRVPDRLLGRGSVQSLAAAAAVALLAIAWRLALGKTP